MPNTSEIESLLVQTGRQLHASIIELLDAMPNAPLRPQELARTLGLKKDVSSLLLRATAQGDPIAVMHQMPGPEALRRTIDAAESLLSDPVLIERARTAVNEYEGLIRSTAGNLTRFNTLLTGWLPEAREKSELLCRQSVYRGMVGIRRATGDLKLSTAIMHPSDDGQHVDMLWLISIFGLHRLHPSAYVRIATRHLNAPTSPDDDASTAVPAINEPGLDLDRYNRSPIGRMRVERVDSTLQFILDDVAVGNQSSVNVMISEFSRRCMNRYNRDPQGRRRSGPVAEVDLPLKSIVFDALVHEDLYPDEPPQLSVFDTSFLGMPSVNDPSRAKDKLDLSPPIQRMPDGLTHLRLPEHSRYIELLHHACDRLGWDPSVFRAYRVRWEYPLYGTSMHMTFRPPLAHDNGTGRAAD